MKQFLPLAMLAALTGCEQSIERETRAVIKTSAAIQDPGSVALRQLKRVDEVICGQLSYTTGEGRSRFFDFYIAADRLHLITDSTRTEQRAILTAYQRHCVTGQYY
jgi:hypothetical protein